MLAFPTHSNTKHFPSQSRLPRAGQSLQMSQDYKNKNAFKHWIKFPCALEQFLSAYYLSSTNSLIFPSIILPWSCSWHFTVPSAVHRWYCNFFFIVTFLPESKSRFPWKWSPWLHDSILISLFTCPYFVSGFGNLLQSCTAIWELCKCANEAFIAEHQMLPSCWWCTQPCLPIKEFTWRISSSSNQFY